MKTFKLDKKEKEVLESFIKSREEYIATHGFLSGNWHILTKEEVEQDRCKAYPYIF